MFGDRQEDQDPLHKPLGAGGFQSEQRVSQHNPTQLDASRNRSAGALSRAEPRWLCYLFITGPRQADALVNQWAARGPRTVRRGTDLATNVSDLVARRSLRERLGGTTASPSRRPLASSFDDPAIRTAVMDRFMELARHKFKA